MEFITLIETNRKENETFVFYLQWTGNEDALTWLYKTIKRSTCGDLYGDYSVFDMNISVKIPEEMVDLQCKLDFGSYSTMFNKVTGFCCIPKLWRKDTDEKDEYEVGVWLDDEFFGCKISQLFYKNIPDWLEQEDEYTENGFNNHK